VYSVRYEIAGRGEPVVLVHGLSGSTRWRSRNIPALAERYCVYLLDLPGFGAMRRLRSRFVLAEAASWLSAWMEAVGLDRERTWSATRWAATSECASRRAGPR
jgi:pimeloyl-ACP methyl ester carboxylesterase